MFLVTKLLYHERCENIHVLPEKTYYILELYAAEYTGTMCASTQLRCVAYSSWTKESPNTL